MSVLAPIKFPQSSLIDKTTFRLSREWQQWFLNPQFLTITFQGVVSIENGGTGIGSSPGAGQILIGNGTTYSLKSVTGDASLSAVGVLSLAAVNPNPGSYGDASHAPVFTVNDKGLITAATEAAISISATDVSGLGTLAVQNANSVLIDGGQIDGVAIGAVTPDTGVFLGVSTNSDAAAGVIGEYIESIVLSGAAVALTTGVAANITNIALSAGDWDVSALIGFSQGATTTSIYMSGGPSTTSATLGAESSYATNSTGIVGTSLWQFPAPTTRFSLAAPTTVYLVAKSGFSVSTMAAYGRISARRVR